MNANETAPKVNLRMNRIKKVIKLVRFLVSSAVIIFLLCGLGFLADLAGYSIIPAGVKISFSPLLTYTSPFSIPSMVLIVAFLRCGLFLVGILVLFWLLDLFEAGNFFTAQSVRHIKSLGALVIVDWVLTKILDSMARSGVEISFGQLVLGLLIFLIAWIMDEGRKIQEEQELTV
jgi:hypothetical protein